MEAQSLDVLPATAKDPSAVPTASPELQARLLQGVSRTFALNIPQLPDALAQVVTTAYLLCRLVDTIEDDPTLDIASKARLSELLVAALAGRVPVADLGEQLVPALGTATPAEWELLHHAPAVVAAARQCRDGQRQALVRCVALMAEGMVDFQRRAGPRQVGPQGLADLDELDRYCYVVAGVVGEMLTALFCDHSPAIAAKEADLMARAVSFGQGLQMTNILKDQWDDRASGVCWLPRALFAAQGCDLARLDVDRQPVAFAAGLGELIGIARGHLHHALEYTLLIPPTEPGIRNFCLWAIGMALLTLRKIDARRDFSRGDQVKISRRSVKATIAISRLTARHDRVLRLLFALLARGLPAVPIACQTPASPPKLHSAP
ncbi:MAG: phytoene/squalene synthase family protein [Candidatus Competibacterales bacterium]